MTHALQPKNSTDANAGAPMSLLHLLVDRDKLAAPITSSLVTTTNTIHATVSAIRCCRKPLPTLAMEA